MKEVLPIVSCAPKTPCIQQVAHNMASVGNISSPLRSNAP